MPSDPPRCGLPPMHPGELLREEVLPGADLSPAQLAVRLRLEARALEIIDLIAERRPITADMALRLSRLLGTRPEFWLNLQSRYDLSKAAELNQADIDAITPLQTS